MSETTDQKTPKIEQEYWLQIIKKFGLAGLGAAAELRDEMETFMQRMVERGEITEQKAQKWMKEFMERGRKQTSDAVHNIGGTGMESIEKLLARLGIPSKKEFQTLSHRVEELAQKVDELAKKITPPPPPVA